LFSECIGVNKFVKVRRNSSRSAAFHYVLRSCVLQTPANICAEFLLNSLMNIQPVQVQLIYQHSPDSTKVRN